MILNSRLQNKENRRKKNLDDPGVDKYVEIGPVPSALQVRVEGAPSGALETRNLGLGENQVVVAVPGIDHGLGCTVHGSR